MMSITSSFLFNLLRVLGYKGKAMFHHRRPGKEAIIALHREPIPPLPGYPMTWLTDPGHRIAACWCASSEKYGPTWNGGEAHFHRGQAPLAHATWCPRRV